jgi:hypothetical protein
MFLCLFQDTLHGIGGNYAAERNKEIFWAAEKRSQLRSRIDVPAIINAAENWLPLIGYKWQTR